MGYRIYQSSQNILFGDLLQCRLIMERNFGGTHFQIPTVPGRNLPEVDVMFFPATFGETVVMDPQYRPEKTPSFVSHDVTFTESETRKYLDKSTIIMCNPNALIY